MVGGVPRRELMLQLQSILADLYRTNDRVLELADRAGLSPADIPQSPIPRSTWWGVLREAENQLLLDRIIELARQDYPRHEGLRLAATGAIADVSGSEVQDWKPPAKAEEVIIGTDDLLPAAFLEVGGQIAKSVVRIALAGGGYGSGFVIANNVVPTNHHVLPSMDDASGAMIELGVQDRLDGIAFPGSRHPTRPDMLFASDKADDWAVVRFDGPAGIAPIELATATVRVGERVYIVQHPGGGPKQVALGDNIVMFVDDKRLQYLTDTHPGSSGSPVFDRNWKLVGLHHSGGWISEPGTKTRQFRNEGIAIAIVRQGLIDRQVAL